MIGFVLLGIVTLVLIIFYEPILAVLGHLFGFLLEPITLGVLGLLTLLGVGLLVPAYQSESFLFSGSQCEAYPQPSRSPRSESESKYQPVQIEDQAILASADQRLVDLDQSHPQSEAAGNHRDEQGRFAPRIKTLPPPPKAKPDAVEVQETPERPTPTWVGKKLLDERDQLSRLSVRSGMYSSKSEAERALPAAIDEAATKYAQKYGDLPTDETIHVPPHIRGNLISDLYLEVRQSEVVDATAYQIYAWLNFSKVHNELMLLSQEKQLAARLRVTNFGLLALLGGVFALWGTIKLLPGQKKAEAYQVAKQA